jgi:tRNA(fMet)-specific endonuclease VapC
VRLLLDTNVISDFVKGEPGVLARLRAESREAVAISVVTAMEIEYGLRLNPARARRIETVLQALFDSMPVLPYEIEDARATASVRASLRIAGKPIGPYDAMIAGTALRRGLILVTANVGEFARVGGLVTENWRKS